jgi:opacity protein-like surface antigen
MKMLALSVAAVLAAATMTAPAAANGYQPVPPGCQVYQHAGWEDWQVVCPNGERWMIPAQSHGTVTEFRMELYTYTGPAYQVRPRNHDLRQHYNRRQGVVYPRRHRSGHIRPAPQGHWIYDGGQATCNGNIQHLGGGYWSCSQPPEWVR